MLHSGDILTLWKRGEGSPVKLGESPVLAEGGSVVLVNSAFSLRAGEAYAFRVSAPQMLESERKPEPVAPSKPSLKDRLGF
jgi:hypothetical protein